MAEQEMSAPLRSGIVRSNVEPLVEQYIASVGFHALLGIKYAAHGPDWLENRLQWRSDLTDEAGGISPGVITALIDATCGAGVLILLEDLVSAVAISLDVDFIRASHADSDLSVTAHCVHASDRIAFVRAVADDGAATHPVAIAHGKFLFERGR